MSKDFKISAREVFEKTHIGVKLISILLIFYLKKITILIKEVDFDYNPSMTC